MKFRAVQECNKQIKKCALVLYAVQTRNEIKLSDIKKAS